MSVSLWALNNYQKIHLNTTWVLLKAKKGAIASGKVTAVDAKGATVELADGVEGVPTSLEASRDRAEDATPGSECWRCLSSLNTLVLTVKTSVINPLSVSAKDEADEKARRYRFL